MHHIVSDGWSMEVLTNELSALYGAFSQGQQDPLPALSVQYADFAAWQRRWLSGDVLQTQSRVLATHPGRRARADRAAHRQAAPATPGPRRCQR